MPEQRASESSLSETHRAVDQHLAPFDRRSCPAETSALCDSNRNRPRRRRASKGVLMKSRLFPALLLGIATITLGPIACNGMGSEAASATGTELGIVKASMDTSV